MRHTKRFMLVLGTVTLLSHSGCERRAAQRLPAPLDVSVTSEDGDELAATLYAVSTDHPPGLLLVHALGADRHTWRSIAVRAQRAGVMSLAVDLRGHGESRSAGDRELNFRDPEPGEWKTMLKDLRAAKNALLDRGADPDNLAIAGASVGANLALSYAVTDLDIQAAVLVSPWLEYKGIAAGPAIMAYGKRPILLITTEGDSYSAASCATLKRAAGGFCELREYPGAAHGTDILANSTSAVEQIVYWLTTTIAPASEPRAQDRVGTAL